jgi:TP901 family phage tail tape measure protein
MALGTEYIIKYLSDISGAVKGAKELETINSNMAKKVQDQYGQVVRVLGQMPTQIKEIPIRVDGKEAIKTIQTVGEVVQTSNGNFLQLSKTTTRVGNDLKITGTSVKDVTSQFVKTNLEAEKGNKVFTNFADNVKQLAGRALLTIPIWIALRGAIMGSFQAIGDGVKNLIAFDLALQKIRNNLSGTPQEVDAAFKKIRASITEASKATGISTEELAGAVKQFATLGFSANESLQGALGASKLSIALFGDASDTAEAFAKALNIMIDRSNGAKSAADQMNEAFALTSQLEQTNNFEIKSVTEALNKFAGTAAGVGLTMNQTLQILAALGTAGRTGSEGATLLSTSFNTLLKNLPQLSKSLGIVVGEGESTFIIFRKILDKITELNNTPGGRNAAIEGISDIFGGARGIKIVQSLVAVKSILDANIAILPDFDALNAKVKRTLESESGQAKLLGNDLKEAGKSFIIAITGTEDFTSALQKLRAIVSLTSNAINGLASSINTIFSNPTTVGQITTNFIKEIKNLDKQANASFLKILDGLKGNLAIPDLKVLIEKVTLHQKSGDEPTIRLLAALRQQLKKQMEAGSIVVEPKIDIKPIISFSDQQKIAKQILEFKLNELKLNDASNVQLLVAKKLYTEQLGIVEDNIEKTQNKLALEQAINEETKRFTDLQKTGLISNQLEFLKLQGATNVQVIEQRIELEKTANIHQTAIDLLNNQLELNKAITEEQINLDNIQKSGLIENQLEALSLQGATNLQIVQQRIELEKLYGINQAKSDLLKNELNLNKEITKEKLNQNKVSSDSLKLFQIAQKFGIQQAQTVATFLSGNLPLQAVEPGGRESAILPILQEFFSAELEQRKAQQFFFEGLGREIQIPERRAIEDFRPTPLEKFKLPDINTQVGQINVEVKKMFKSEDTAKQIMDSLIDAIRNNPVIENAINEKIDNF